MAVAGYGGVVEFPYTRNYARGLLTGTPLQHMSLLTTTVERNDYGSTIGEVRGLPSRIHRTPRPLWLGPRGTARGC